MQGGGAAGPAGTAGRGPAGEVKACVNVLNIVRKRHLQLPTRRGAKGKGSGGMGGGMLGATLRGRRHAAGCSACKRRDYIMYKWELYHKPPGVFS